MDFVAGYKLHLALLIADSASLVVNDVKPKPLLLGLKGNVFGPS